jgi:hypothetical protein
MGLIESCYCKDTAVLLRQSKTVVFLITTATRFTSLMLTYTKDTQTFTPCLFTYANNVIYYI